MATTLESLDASQRELLSTFCKSFPTVTESTALRFLVARKFDLAKAEAFLRSDQEWRASYQPEAVTQARLERCLPSGCWRILGAIERDGGSAAVLWIQLSLWRPDEYDVDEYTAMVVYFLEHLPTLGATFVVLFDMEGWRISHGFHLRKVQSLISTLQDHYPERLRAALLARTPGIFEASWKLIRPWIDPITASKVHFVPRGDAEQGALEAHIDAALLPSAYGGELAADEAAVPGLPGEPSVVVVPPPSSRLSSEDSQSRQT